MGLGLYFAEGEGPKFERPLREEWAINNLTVTDPYEHLGYVMDAVSEIRRAAGHLRCQRHHRVVATILKHPRHRRRR